MDRGRVESKHLSLSHYACTHRHTHARAHIHTTSLAYGLSRTTFSKMFFIFFISFFVVSLESALFFYFVSFLYVIARIGVWRRHIEGMVVALSHRAVIEKCREEIFSIRNVKAALHCAYAHTHKTARETDPIRNMHIAKQSTSYFALDNRTNMKGNSPWPV